MINLILSPDTNIFITAFLGKNEKERFQFIMLIGTDLKQSRSVLVYSVKKEFNKLIDEAQELIEDLVTHLNSSKTMTEAILLLPDSSLI